MSELDFIEIRTRAETVLGRGRNLGIVPYSSLYSQVELCELAVRLAADVVSLLDVNLDSRATQLKLNRRAQAAESQLARVPTLEVLGDALAELKRVKSDRHRLRNENAFMRIERGRLQKTVADLRASLAEQERANESPA